MPHAPYAPCLYLEKRSLCEELEYPVLQAALNDVGMVAEGLKETNVMSRQVKEGFPTPIPNPHFRIPKVGGHGK